MPRMRADALWLALGLVVLVAQIARPIVGADRAEAWARKALRRITDVFAGGH